MKINYYNTFIFSFMVFISCAEPFDFGIEPQVIDIVDGKISTIEGRSYIRIYEFLNDSTQRDKIELDVRVVDRNGTIIQFMYDSGRFIPSNPTFSGLIGNSYRMIATATTGEIYESEFDAVPDAIQLSMFTKDTFRLRLTTLNIIEEVEGVSAVARIPSGLLNQYLRLQFEYSYLNPLTSKTDITTFPGQFRLLACDSQVCGQQDSLNVPVGNTFQTDWTFLNTELPECLRAFDTLNVNDPTQCFTPCCTMIDEWNTEFKIYLESMTFDSYNYWKDIERLRENEGLLLDTFPFPLSGNVSCVGCSNKVVGSVRSVSETFATTMQSL